MRSPRRHSPLPKRPRKSSCSKRKSASKPTATPAKKSTLAFISTASSGFASSRASTLISTAPTRRSRFRSFTSRTRAAARPTFLPSAITDEPNPAVADFPAYHDVRVKSIRILGLEPADILEYRVITTTTNGPLAPDFWLDHNFDRTGVVTKEIFELDLPAQRFASQQASAAGAGQIRVSKETPEASKTQTGTGDDARLVYRWNISTADLPKSANDPASGDSDVVLTTFASWDQLQQRLQSTLQPHASGGALVASGGCDEEHVSRSDRAGNGLLQFRRHENSHRRSPARSRDDSANVITRKCCRRASRRLKTRFRCTQLSLREQSQ